MLFSIEKEGILKPIRENEFKLEREIQRLTEQNLMAIFNLELVKSEFSLNSFRIDTLAFDRETNSFVIIEYKRDKNYSVVDQGYAYLALMLNNKADFILEYNERFPKPLKRDEIDWSQSKVIFVSPSFTTYQKEAINFKDLPIELWEVRRYSNESVSFNQIQKANAKESIKTITRKDETVRQIEKEIVVYSEEGLLKEAKDEIKELYESYRAAILNLGNVDVVPTKLYLTFKSGAIFNSIVIQQKGLKIYPNLKIGELDDPHKLARDVSKIGRWTAGEYEIAVKDDENMDAIIGLIKQAYLKNRKA